MFHKVTSLFTAGEKANRPEETEAWTGNESGLESEFMAHSKCSKREWPLKGCTGSRGRAARRRLFSGRQRAPFPIRGHTEVGVKGSGEQTPPQEECEAGECGDQDCFSALTSPGHLTVGQRLNISELQSLVKLEMRVPTSQ